jgi:PAS domain S-box-containing protein
MSNTAPNQAAFKLRPIPALLAICFIILLILIWGIGKLGQLKLAEIQIRADESTRAYTDRLKLAIDIREAAALTIARVRLYRASRGIKISGPVFKVDLNEAQHTLELRLKEGLKLWGAKNVTLPPGEKQAWQNLHSVIDEFWTVVFEEENFQSLNKSPKVENPGHKSEPQEGISPPSLLNENADQAFFQKRTKLEAAAEDLSAEIEKGLQNSQDRIEELKNRAAEEVAAANRLTLFMGIIVIGITIALLHSYIKQTKQEERLKVEAQGRLRSVFDSLSDDIVVLSKQGEVVEVNHAFIKHYKLNDDELKSQDYQQALAQIPEIASFVGKTFQEEDFEKRQRERIEVKTQNGRPGATLFDVSVSPLIVGEQTNGRVVVMNDVTEDERVREELRRSRTLSAVGQITAQVAHEIYNPLGAVKLNLELLEMQLGDTKSEVKPTLGRLTRGVDHLSTIIMDLRYLTRPREPERKPTDINKLLDEVIELTGDRLERSRISVVRNYCAELNHSEVDPQQLRKVFLNLLINAVEASPQNGEVELCTRLIPREQIETIADFNPTNHAIVASVIDHGVGMSSETKRRLFEAFYTTKQNGTGLGMMITQEIVKKHGGKIVVKSEEGKGTNVSVYLPL